jgi:hypothetical protein
MADCPSRPIIVLGFGRSGTTWIADIISKVLGGLILFEPFHPQVCPLAAEVCYATALETAISQRLAAYLEAVLRGHHRQRWLLRNHLFTPLEEVSQAYVDMIWDECPILGFKEIRATFLIDWLIERFEARIVFLLRHPCAVLASIRRRPRFWDEFGWEQHYRFFRERVIEGWPEAYTRLAPRLALLEPLRTDLEKQAVMWAITADLAVWQLERHGLPVFRYEDFYDHPFAATRALMAYLGEPRPRIHPAHLFVPSMTTLRTVHGLVNSESDYRIHGQRLFWRDVLSREEEQTIMSIIGVFAFDRWYREDLWIPGYYCT